jgi:hypothetical protein
MRWEGDVARMEQERKYKGFWWESQKGRDHLEDQKVNGRMGSERIFGRLAGGV